MKRRARACVAIAALALAALSSCGASGASRTTGSAESPAAAGTAPEVGVGLKRIGDFDSPVYVTGAPGAPKLLFVVEQARQDPGAARTAGAWAGRSSTSPSWSPSKASAGCSRSPSRPTTRPAGASTSITSTGPATSGSTNSSAASPTRAAAGSRRNVIEIPHPINANHNGGQLQFLGDLLYFGTGDGGSRRRPPEQRPEQGEPAGQAAADRSPPLRRPALHGSRLQPLRRQAGPRRDLQLRAAQPVPLLLRHGQRAGAADRDRRRRPEPLRGGRLHDRRRRLRAPTSAGTPSRASPPTAKKTAARPTRAAR